MANPTLLTRPLCENADKNTIPPTDVGTSGLFSEEYGWQNINSLPLASGGKAPNRRDFNGVFALLGGIAYACQRGYTFEWDSTQDYVVGCVVLDTNDNKRYECISDVTANATPPNADTTHWKEFGADMTVLANTDLSNLTATGETKFTGKADTSLSNLTQAGKSFYFPSDTYINITSLFSNNGDTYTAIADGYISVEGLTTGGGSDLLLTTTNSLSNASFLNKINNTLYCFLPVKNGQTVTLGIYGITIQKSTFVYCEGEVPTP